MNYLTLCTPNILFIKTQKNLYFFWNNNNDNLSYHLAPLLHQKREWLNEKKSRYKN